MSYATYKVLHLLGVMLLFFALGGMTLHALNGGDKESNKAKGLVYAFHGVALLLLLVAGFGAMAKMGIKGGVPVWVWLKLGVWLLLAASPALITRKPDLGKALWFVLPLAGGLAGFLAVTKLGA